jgi:hypothetical protein
MKKSLLLVAAVLAASGAQAQTVGPVPVNALAGLAPAMTLTCTDVNFGVWSVPAGDRGGSTTITMTVNTPDSATAVETVVAAPATGIAQIRPDSAGRCKVEGAWNAVTASMTGAAVTFTTSNHVSNTVGVVVPTVTAPMTGNLVLSTTTPAVTALSEAWFYVVGTMTIPNNLVAGNYGGYRSAVAAQVSVTQ